MCTSAASTRQAPTAPDREWMHTGTVLMLKLCCVRQTAGLAGLLHGLFLNLLS